MLDVLRAYPEYTRKSLKFHVPAVLLDGLAQGVAILFLVVARKTLDASDLVITVLTQAPVAVMLFANVAAIRMIGKPKKPYLLLAAAIGRLPYLAIFFVHDASVYAALLFFSFFYYLWFKPAENSIFQANYDPEQRGAIFGYLNGLQLLSILLGAFLGGMILNHEAQNYRLLIPAAGLAGIGALLLYAFLPVRRMTYDQPLTTRIGVLDAYRNFFTALFRDRPFGRMELCFLIYGFGIIMLDPLIVIFVVDDLKLDYAQMATALGLVGQGTMLVAMPLLGRIYDRFHPTAVLSASVLGLLCFPLTLYFAHGVAGLYLAFLFRGVAMSGVNLVWNLGPIHFAQGKDSSNYMGVHMTLTGVRGLLAPIMGMGLYYLLGIRNAFLVSIAIFVVSGSLAALFAKRDVAPKGV